MIIILCHTDPTDNNKIQVPKNQKTLSFPLIDSVRHFVWPHHHTSLMPKYMEDYLKNFKS